MLDGILRTIGRGHGSGRYQHKHHDHRGGHHHLGAGLLLDAARGVLRRPGLLIALAAFGAVLLALGVWMVVAILSHAGPLLDFVSRHGLKGVTDAAFEIARRLWEGTGGR